ncbi:MAG: Lrp/AsnC family transcriptional regulator [Candidatus Hydrogenedentota bacterium]|nr:MAG: Lrp/AsnC family transcriptional regulator [Candidatus Hydrogenedentota bacterium]
MKVLSEKEIKLLELFQEDGRMSDEKVALMLGIPEKEAKDLREGLEEAGIILKYRAVINWEKIETTEVIALIQVSVTPRKGLGYDEVAAKISALPEVQSCLLVSGSFDLLVEVTGPSLKDVAFFVADKLAVIEGVEHTRTNFLLKRYKQSGDMFSVSRKTHRLPMVI